MIVTDVSSDRSIALEFVYVQGTPALELYRLMGLDPTRSLYVDRGSRTVLPEIVQTLDDNTIRTIVTRIP